MTQSPPVDLTQLVPAAGGRDARSFPELREADPDRFDAGDVLGQGGMGVVRSADDRAVGRAVALKQLAPDAPPAQVQLLVDEARVQGRLDHPAIPPVFEVGVDRALRPYFAMRRVEGETLAALLGRLRAGDAEAAARFPRDRLLRLFVELCLAIEHAHRRGVVHLDLKPGNVMITAAGRVCVLDWGIAELLAPDEAPRRARPRAGTLGYLAPELLDAEQAPTVRADVYSLGCILFEVLAGEPLHPKGEGVLASVLRGADARPSSRTGGVGTPAALEAACARAAARDRDARHASAGELADEITAWLDDDRDAALRLELAREHVAAARDHLARGGADDRDRALAEASRALALAPDDADARGLVRELLGGDDLPAGARAELDALDAAAERRLARAAAGSVLGFLLLPLTLLLQGGADRGFVVAVIALTGALLALTSAAARGRGPRAWLWWCVGGLAGLAVLYSRYLGPFLITPVVAALTAAGVMMHPRVRRGRAVVAALCATIFLPYALELAGVLAPTSRFAGGRWWLSSTVSDLRAGPTMIGLAAAATAFVAVAVVIGRIVATPAHETRRRLAAQAWHLERLLPGAVEAGRAAAAAAAASSEAGVAAASAAAAGEAGAEGDA